MLTKYGIEDGSTVFVRLIFLGGGSVLKKVRDSPALRSKSANRFKHLKKPLTLERRIIRFQVRFADGYMIDLEMENDDTVWELDSRLSDRDDIFLQFSEHSFFIGENQLVQYDL